MQSHREFHTSFLYNILFFNRITPIFSYVSPLDVIVLKKFDDGDVIAAMPERSSSDAVLNHIV